MINLTSTQRAFLRGMANTLSPMVMVGKDGLNDAVLAQLDETLEAKELVKVSLLESAPLTVNEACAQASSGTDAAPVQKIGRRFVLYRPKKEAPVIVLPGAQKRRK